MNNKMYLEYLKREISEAYKNSISLEMIYSSNPNIKTRTSEAKRLSELERKARRLEFKIRMEEIESKLPDFSKMNNNEICDFIDHHGGMMHYVPVFTQEPEYAILHENGDYYLGEFAFSKEGNFIASGYGFIITNRIVDILSKRGWNIIEN